VSIFEDGFEVDLSAWTQLKTSTTSEINLVTAQKHSGAKAVEVFQTVDDGDTLLYFTLAAAVQLANLTIWFYDDGGSITDLTQIAYAEDEAFVECRIGLRGATSLTNYVYKLGAGAWTASSVSRSAGWHKFGWYVDVANIYLLVDDVQIATSNIISSLYEFAIVSAWKSRAGFYYDDVLLTYLLPRKQEYYRGRRVA
jgi:hypothetical protein